MIHIYLLFFFGISFSHTLFFILNFPDKKHAWDSRPERCDVLSLHAIEFLTMFLRQRESGWIVMRRDPATTIEFFQIVAHQLNGFGKEVLEGRPGSGRGGGFFSQSLGSVCKYRWLSSSLPCREYTGHIMWHEPWLSRLEHSILGEVSTSDRRRLQHSQKEKEGKE